MASLKAEFDGHVFVPMGSVQLPVGTQVEVTVLPPAARPTPEEDAEWRDIRREIAASPAPFPTVDDALRHSRSRP